jgi:hypothetical protein
MDIHLFYNKLLGRLWIHATNAIIFFLYQRVKFIINCKLVIVKSEKALTMVINMAILYIIGKNNTYGNLHSFKVVNVEWVPNNTIRHQHF